MSWQTKIIIAICGLLSLVLILVSSAIQSELIIFARLLLVVFGISFIGLIVLIGSIGRETYLTKRAERKQKEFVLHNDGYGMAHLINAVSGHSQNLTVDARAYRNGHYEKPEDSEIETLRLILAARHASTSKLMLAPPSSPEPESQQLDLLTILTQPTQSYAIIGGQQVGKTYQARRIANYWLQAGNKPIVIGPKWDRGEWDGCTLFGGEYNFDRVAQGMRIVQRLAEERHADKNRSHKEQPVQPVFFDDWTAIRAKLENEAEAFILDATTLYASVNIILYFIIHLDTANAWGVGRVGAALHQNFYKLFVEPGTNEMGLIDRSRNVGWLLRPGKTKKDRERIQLFGGVGQPLALPAEPVIIQPPNEDREVIELANQGLSYKEVTEAIYGIGKYGKFYNDKIDKILAKYGLRIAPRIS